MAVTRCGGGSAAGSRTNRSAQEIWATYGYRPIDKTVAAKWIKTFPVPKKLFTIREIVKGGWPVVQPKFFDPNNGILKQIQNGN